MVSFSLYVIFNVQEMYYCNRYIYIYLSGILRLLHNCTIAKLDLISNVEVGFLFQGQIRLVSKGRICNLLLFKCEIEHLYNGQDESLHDG